MKNRWEKIQSVLVSSSQGLLPFLAIIEDQRFRHNGRKNGSPCARLGDGTSCQVNEVNTIAAVRMPGHVVFTSAILTSKPSVNSDN